MHELTGKIELPEGQDGFSIIKRVIEFRKDQQTGEIDAFFIQRSKGALPGAAEGIDIYNSLSALTDEALYILV
jgi:hypothetical protein